MRFFSYQNGELYAENVALSKLAKEFGTPLYVYSAATLRHHYKILENALAGLEYLIAFAVKANSNISVLRELGKLGAGADTVSEGEIKRALIAGIDAKKIVFSGVGKSKKELEFAVKNQIRQINVESEAELFLLDEIAQNLGQTQDIVFRINPDVGAGGHSKITTGHGYSKFGIGIEKAKALYEIANALKGVNPRGFAVHIGSQISNLEPLRKAYLALAQLTQDIRAKGFKIDRLDLGGGLAAIYDDSHQGPDIEAWGKMVHEIIAPLNIELEIEPGRMIAANSGILLSQVLLTKQNGEREFLVLDAAMNDLLRPALYEAYHQILPVAEKPKGANTRPFDVVGPICETGDTFAENRLLPDIKEGELVAFMTAGAYGFTMASNYNSRPMAAEVLIDGSEYKLIRRRQTFEEMLALEA